MEGYVAAVPSSLRRPNVVLKDVVQLVDRLALRQLLCKATQLRLAERQLAGNGHLHQPRSASSMPSKVVDLEARGGAWRFARGALPPLLITGPLPPLLITAELPEAWRLATGVVSPSCLARCSARARRAAAMAAFCSAADLEAARSAALCSATLITVGLRGRSRLLPELDEAAPPVAPEAAGSLALFARLVSLPGLSRTICSRGVNDTSNEDAEVNHGKTSGTPSES